MIELVAGHGMSLMTPLGAVTMSHLRAASRAKHRVQSVGADGRSCTWILPGLTARLSIFPFDADLDPDIWVRPVHCWAFLWELDPLSPCPGITLEMSFADPVRTRSAAPDSGQAFTALNVDTDGWELIIGGPDEEQLAADAALGLVPIEWRPGLVALAESSIGDPLAEVLPGMRGLRWNLPAMHVGQRCRIGANACWSPSRSPAQAEDESTWFAALTTTATHLEHRATHAGE